MNNDTLNALILRHGENLLRRSGWPDSIDMTPVAPDTVPGWLVACGSLSGEEILTLTEQICQPLTYGRAALLTACAWPGHPRGYICIRSSVSRTRSGWLTVRSSGCLMRRSG